MYFFDMQKRLCNVPFLTLSASPKDFLSVSKIIPKESRLSLVRVSLQKNHPHLLGSSKRESENHITQNGERCFCSVKLGLQSDTE